MSDVDAATKEGNEASEKVNENQTEETPNSTDSKKEEKEDKENENKDEKPSTDDSAAKDSSTKSTKKTKILEALNTQIFGDSDEEETPQQKNDDEDFEESKPKKKKKEETKKKRKKSSKKEEKTPKKEKKEKKESEEPATKDTENVGEGEEEEQEEEGEALVASSSSTTVGKKTKMAKKEVLEKAEAKATDLVAKMEQAAVEDLDLLKRGVGPAINKVGMLQEVAEFLNKPLMHEPLLARDVLSTLAKWMALLPDGSLPNPRIRETLLNILLHFPSLNRDELAKSGIAKSVMGLWKHKSELPQNKKVAKILIDRWSRIVFDKSAEWKDLQKDDEFAYSESAPSPAPKKSFSTQDDTDNSPKTKKKDSNPHAMIPERMSFDFKIRPSSFVVEEKNKPTAKKDSKFAKLLQKAKGSGGGSELSIEGRSLSEK